MSSVGQAVGMVVGGIIGAFIPGGYIMLGAAIGGAIGGYIDPPKGKDVVGPRLEDLTVQTSTYGAILPRVKGTVGVTGNVVWLEGDKIKEHKKTKKVGGKGGGGAKQTTYSYSATFAVGLSHQIAGPITAIRRLWIGNKLVFEASSGNIESIVAGAVNMVLSADKNSTAQAAYLNQPSYAVYYGSDDQQPDPRIQADKGIANVSGYPGRCYIVFYDLDLTEHYNNTLMAAQVKVEVTMGAASVGHSPLQDLAGTFPPGRNIYGIEFGASKATYSIFNYQTWDQFLISVEFWEMEYGVTNKQIGGYGLGDVTFGDGNYRLYICQSDRPVLMTMEGNDDGYGHKHTFVNWYEYDGTVTYSAIMGYGTTPYLPYHDYSVAIDGSDTFFCWKTGGPIYKMQGNLLVGDSGGSYEIEKSGLSENYFFGVYDSGYPSSSTTVYKFDRTTLALTSTYTQPVVGTNAAIRVVDDDTFYTLSGDHVYKWESGVVSADLGALLNFPAATDDLRAWFNIVSDSPPYGFSFYRPASGETLTPYVGYQTVDAGVAKLRDIVTEECALVGITSGDLDLTELTNSDVRGYRVSSAGSVRSVLEQLQAVFPFDVIQSGYKLKFKSRGGASALTVPEADLGAHTGNEVPSRFVTVKEMPSQVPAKVTFNFLNADREYDPDAQSASFTAQDVKNSYTVSLPIVLTPQEALRAADVLLRKEQAERTSAGTFWLPPSDDYRKLEAADVIDVVAQGRTHTLRLTKVTQLPDGRIECDGKLTSSAAYTSTAEAQSPLVLGPTTVTLAGSSELVLLDIPRIVTDQDQTGLSLGMYGYTSGWPGGIALRSDDGGETYAAIVSFDSKTEVFTAGAPIGADNGYAVDNSSFLTVTPNFSEADLFSITETQLYAHGNLAAYGVDGRWEILAFKTATVSGSDYVLSQFRRGLYGTEWATGLHAAGDLLVMLDVDTNDFASLPLSAINSPRLWRGITSGASIDSDTDTSHSYGAVNLKPLSPVDMKGSRDPSTLDWTITGQRRTRTPTELFSGVAVPLGETSESYDVEVWNSAYSALKRTFSALSSLSTQYTNAQQVADFGSVQDTLYLKAYQLSPAVGRGFPYTQSIYRYLPLDPFGDQVVLLQSMNDVGLTDFRGHGVTLAGGLTRSATYSQEGGYSASFNGTTQYYFLNGSSDFSFGTGDFTIEGFIRPSSVSANMNLFDFRPLSTNGVYVALYLSSSGQISYYVSSADKIIGAHGLLTTEFAHYALVRSGGVSKLYIKGQQVGSNYTDTNNFGISANRPLFGVSAYSGTTAFFSGYADQQRITKAARYTGNFTPPTSFPNP